MPLIAAILAALGPWLSRLVSMYGALWVVKILSVIGISFATHEFLISPLLDQIGNGMGAAPAAVRAWMGAFGVDQALSIIVSAFAVSMGKKALVQMAKPT